MKHFSSLIQSKKGSITVELAFAAPLLAALLIGLVDISGLYSDKLRIEQIAQRIIEKVQRDGFKSSQEATLESEAATAAGTGAVADVTFWVECNSVRQTGSTAWTNGCGTGQSVARYVQLDVSKSYSPIILARFGGSATDGSYTIHGIAGVRIQ